MKCKMRLNCAGVLAVWIICFATGSGAAIDFGAAVNYLVGDRPAGIAAGDFDKDGDVDLAVTTDNIDKVGILMNTGGGAFVAPVNYPTGGGTGPGAMAAVDLDKDQDLDLVVALQNTNSIIVFTNNGGGTFAVGGTTPVGLNPRDVDAGDVDRDSDMDIVVVNRDSNSFTVLLNNNGVLSGSSYTVGADPRAAVLADFDGINGLDIVVTNHDDRDVSVLFNTGSGTFGGRTDYSVGATVRPEGVAAGKLDGDADIDIVVTTSDNGISFAAVLMNNGNGVFAGPTNYATSGLNSGDILLADLDGDHDLDVATANQDSANISAMANNGAGAFGVASLFAVGTTPERLVAADFDKDLAMDLATVNRDSNNLSILINLLVVGPEFYAPNNATILRGTYNSGNVASFAADDDNYWVQGAAYNAADPLAVIDASLQVDTNTNFSSYSGGSAEVILKANTNNAKYRVRAIRAGGGFTVLIDNAQSSFGESTLNGTIPNPVSDFINAASGNKTSLEVRCASSNRFAGFFRLSVDMTQWIFTP